jgi:hypothetical protein
MVATENISEIFYLLNFFSKTRSEQWSLVPHYFPPAWVRTASSECNVYNSIYFLSCILSGGIEDAFPASYDLNNDFSAILQDEIKPLIDNWMTQYDDSIFEMEDVSNASKIWLILSRLCKISLSYEDFSEYCINELSFEYFLNKYTSPYDPV